MSRSVIAARCAATGAALLCGAALAACGPVTRPSSGGKATVSGGQATAPATAGTPASASPSPASPGSTGGPGSTAAAGPCPASALTVTVDVRQGSGAAGSAYYPIDFANTSAAVCTMFGYPGVSFVTGQGGTEIGRPASRDSAAPPATVTLAPGGFAHAVLQVVDAGNYDASACHPVTAHWLRVFPPGQSGPRYASFTTQVCSARLPAKLGSPLSVFPVRDGKGKMGQAP